MSTRRLVIDSANQQGFVLLLQNGRLTIGPDAAHPDLALTNCRVLGFHCEVEVSDQPLVVDMELKGRGALPRGQVLPDGHSLQAGLSYVELVEAADADDEPHEETCPERYVAITEGPDRGRTFSLNVPGRFYIGKSTMHCDIVLHDLSVSRVQCELQVSPKGVVLTHVGAEAETRVNGTAVTTHALRVGDSIRMGKSQIRLEAGSNHVIPPETSSLALSDDTAVLAEPIVTTVTAAPQTSPFRSRMTTPPPPTADPLEELCKLEGERLGRFHLGAVLGVAVTGLVFKAQDLTNNHTVALKVLSPEFPVSEPEMANFMRALKQAATLHHPNLVAILAAGRSGKYCWIAREYVEGEDLEAFLERLKNEEKRGWKRACRVAFQIGHVLAYLETRQLNHGSLTPANILIEASSKSAKLADLMLDQALADSQLEKRLAHKRENDLPYRAPEWLLQRHAVDACSNIYSLGCIVYSLLSGHPPFAGISRDDLLCQMDGRLNKPSKYVRDIPPLLESALLKMLCKQRSERYPNATAMLADIEPIANMHGLT